VLGRDGREKWHARFTLQSLNSHLPLCAFFNMEAGLQFTERSSILLPHPLIACSP